MTLPAAAAALVQTSNRNAVAHRTIGLLLAASIGGQVIVGVAVRSWLRSDKPPPSYWMRVRQVHRVLGYIMVATGLANCYLGADMLLRGYGRWLVLSYIVALIVGYIGLSLHDEFYRDRTSNTLIVLDKNNARRLAMSQAANSMSLADVRANVAAGCRWVIVQVRGSECACPCVCVSPLLECACAAGVDLRRGRLPEEPSGWRLPH